MNVRLLVTKVGQRTGKMLAEELAKRGITVNENAKATVCYGLGTTRRPALNGSCSDLDKIERLQRMQECGISVVPWFKGRRIPNRITFPLLARKRRGSGGKDIIPVLEPCEVAWRIDAGWDWFSSYIPDASEYRVWVFRNEVIAAYEKTLKNAEDYKRFGRGYKNGFMFTRVSRHFDKNICSECLRGLKALCLDFGAVDILQPVTGPPLILEVNTAPGVSRNAHIGLRRLANRTKTWLKEGCPTW